MSMTENEAIKEIETSLELAEMCEPNRERDKEIKAYKMAIKALEEIQQYRELGTVELLIKSNAKALSEHMELEQYKEIGTVQGYERAIQCSLENYNLYKEYKDKSQSLEKERDMLEYENHLAYVEGRANASAEYFNKAIDKMVEGIKEILECNSIHNVDPVITLAEQLKEDFEFEKEEKEDIER